MLMRQLVTIPAAIAMIALAACAGPQGPAETTKSWLVLFARAVRPTARSARRLARQRPVYVYVDDLCHQVATASTFSKSTINDLATSALRRMFLQLTPPKGR
jgi:hypothetical protein